MSVPVTKLSRNLRRTLKVSDWFEQLAAHHGDSAAHSLRVAGLARLIARELQCPEEMCALAYEAGLLHDIGKINVDVAVLGKAGPLSDGEYAAVRQHAEDGGSLLADDPTMTEIAEVAAQHHERLDGTGYPLQLAGDEIGLLPRIVAVADTYDAITAARQYSPAQPREVALTELRACSPSAFDPKVVEALARALEADPSL